MKILLGNSLTPEQRVRWHALGATSGVAGGKVVISEARQIKVEYGAGAQYDSAAAADFSLNTPIIGCSADEATQQFKFTALNSAGIEASVEGIKIFVAPEPNLPFSLEGRIPGAAASIGAEAGGRTLGYPASTTAKKGK
jgi:hypothetical protein